MKARMGRPRRTDDPQPLTILLPGALKRWLGAQAKREGRGMGVIVVDGLTLYQARANRARRTHGKEK